MTSTNLSYARRMAETAQITLVGGTVTGVFITPFDESNALPEGYGFTVKSPDGVTRNVFVLIDPEGNGPGHLEIQDTSLSQTAVSTQGNVPDIKGWHCSCSDNYVHSKNTLWCFNCGMNASDLDEGKEVKK